MNIITRVLAMVSTVILLAACGSETDTPAVQETPAEATSLTIQEWPVEWPDSRPRDPYVAPDGRVWFCGQRSGYLAVFDPATGEMTKYDLGEGAGPHNLIVDGDGMVWYAGNRRAHIGMLNPETGEITQYPMPRKDARDPHTLIWAPDGNIWFTLQGANMVGHLDRTTGEVTLMDVPTEGARPYGIWLNADNEPWIALFGTNKLAHVDPATMTLTEIALPNEDTRPRRLVITSDDRVWVGDYTRGYLGAYTPANGSYEEWALPSGPSSRPYAMQVDDQDRVWVVETGVEPNLFVAFDPAAETFHSPGPVPSGGGTVRHMYYDADEDVIWFGTDTNYLGKAVLP